MRKQGTTEQTLSQVNLGGGSGSVPIYELKAQPDTVHWGHFSSALKPIVSINSNDILVIEDVPSVDPEVVEQSGVAALNEIPENHRAIYREVKD